MRRFLLVYPSQFYCPDPDTYPIVMRTQLVKLYSFLRARSVSQVRILDLELELGRPCDDREVDQFLERAGALVGSERWDFIGISCYTSVSYTATLEVANLLRVIHPKAVIAVGGYHCLASPEDFTGCNAIDHVVRGDGLPFLDSLLRGELLPRVVSYSGTAPDPNPMLYSEYPYRYRKHPPVAHIQLSRGCPFQCHFCPEPFTGNSRFVPLPVDEAIAKVDNLIRVHRPDKVIIEDLIFGFHAGWRYDFLEALRDRRYTQIFWAEMRVDTITERTAALLSEINFDLTIGLESASAATLQSMGKTNNPERYIQSFAEVARTVQMHQVPTTFTIMLNFPGETLETFDETMFRLEDAYERVQRPQYRFDFLEYSFYPGNRTYEDIDDLKVRFGTEVEDRKWYLRRDGLMLEKSLVAAPSARLVEQVGSDSVHRYYQSRVDRILAKHQVDGDLRSRLFWSYRFVRSLQRRWGAIDGEDYFARDLEPQIRMRARSMAALAEAHFSLTSTLSTAQERTMRATWTSRMDAWRTAFELLNKRLDGPDILDNPGQVKAITSELCSWPANTPRFTGLLSDSAAARARPVAWKDWI